MSRETGGRKGNERRWEGGHDCKGVAGTAKGEEEMGETGDGKRKGKGGKKGRSPHTHF